MKKRGVQKTYGRSSVLSRQNTDFDKVFSVGNSSGNSPFGTSDSSAAKSVDLTDSYGPYNLRRHLCDSLRDVSNESSMSRDNLTTPLMNKAKRTTLQRERKKKVTTRHASKPNPNKKENSLATNIPDYDAIAEDSFVVETENDVAAVTKCSTPLANNSGVKCSGEVPTVTPIFQVPQSTEYRDRSGTYHSHYSDLPCDNKLPFSPVEKPSVGYLSSDCVTKRDLPFSCAEKPHSSYGYPSSSGVTRRSSRLKTKLITSRKLLIEDDDKVISLTPCRDTLSSSHNSTYSNSSALRVNPVNSFHEVSSLVSNQDSVIVIDESADDLLKRIGANISNLAAINLSLDCEIPPGKNTVSPVERSYHIPTNSDSTNKSCGVASFDASHDLFQSHDQSQSYHEGLTCISEEESIYESSMHSMQTDHQSLSRSLLHRLSTNSICDHEVHTAKDKLFDICRQGDYVSFSTAIPTRMMSKCVKIGEGVYGEVFRSVSHDQNVAIKIIPMEGDFDINDCPQKTFEELLPEAVIATELSDLACGFCTVNRISCVQGSFPAPLLKQWDAYTERKVSENDRPDIFPKDQLFAVFEFADGGAALENFEMSNHRESLSVLRQVVFALAVAECQLEFEHRDLHIGNVLVRPCQDEAITFSLQGEDVDFPTEGVLATIIDFTISRLKKDGCAVFCDVSTDEGLFEGSGDIQFDVYRDMRTGNHNDWSKFSPYSNVLWTAYLCKKLLNVVKVKDTGREHRDSLRRLRQINEKIPKYESCFHLASNDSLWDF